MTIPISYLKLLFKDGELTQKDAVIILLTLAHHYTSDKSPKLKEKELLEILTMWENVSSNLTP